MRLPAAVLAGAALAGGCTSAPGETLAPAPVAMQSDPAATAVAVAIVVPGSGWEIPGLEGLTLLTAMTLLEQVRPMLEGLGARASVRCDPAAFTFTLVAPPDGWQAALPVFLDGLFRPDPGGDALAAARAELDRTLALDRANPAWQARLGARQALYGAGHDPSGWTSPACGVPESIGRFSLEHVRAGAYRFDPARTAAVVAGAVGDEAGAMVRARLRPGSLPRIDAPRSIHPGRRYMERNTVTAWITLAFPFDTGADVEAIRLLGALMADAVTPGLDRPDVFDAGHEVEVHGAGGALMVHVVTAPAAAQRYAALLGALPGRWAAAAPSAAVYERVSRRHRGQRLLELAAPEARAAALALELAAGRPPGTGWPDPATLDRVRSAAAGLGPPALVVVGPGAARDAATP